MCVSVHFHFKWNSDSWFGSYSFFLLFCKPWSSWCFPLSLFSKILSHYSLTLFFSLLSSSTWLLQFVCIFFFFCLFCYMICSVVIDIFAASPPSWKPSDFNVRLCLALLEFSLYRYNSFIHSTTLTHSALSSLLPACQSCLLWSVFCSSRPSVGFPRSDLLHSGWDSGFTRQSSGKASGVRS